MTGTERVVVIGGDAAGMSAAHQAIRSAKALGRELEVIALERTNHTSYSACGIPYWVAGDVPDYSELVARTPEQHREMGVDLRTGATAVEMDAAARTLTYLDGSGATTLEFDQLVIATGATSVVPAWAQTENGALRDGVGVVKDITDGEEWIARLAGPVQSEPVVVVGAGYIGVEMAEAALRRGHEVILVTRSHVMSTLDPEMSLRVERAMIDSGLMVVLGAAIVGAEVDELGRIARLTTSTGMTIACSYVAVAMGVVPAVDFAATAGFAVGASGGLQPDPTGAIGDGIWAVGDCCEVRHRITGEWAYIPLGTHANKQGKLVGGNLLGGSAEFGGVLGTAITRFVHGTTHVEIARTGLSSREASAAGFEPVALVTDGRTASGYMPEARRMATNIIVDRNSRLLLGGQIVGGERSAKRIDTIAAALWGRLTVDDLAGMDLAYAPPFATVWEAVQLAARRAADRI